MRLAINFPERVEVKQFMIKIPQQLIHALWAAILLIALSSCEPERKQKKPELSKEPEIETIGGLENYLERNVVYGTRGNLPLIMDVAQPAKPNGAALLAIQSGGWHSNHFDSFQKFPPNHALLLQGYTIFVIWHSNPPTAKVPDVVADVKRAVRFIHANAKRWKIDPDRLAAFGVSSGGHLSLMLATSGDDGNPASKDLIERHSSRIHTAMVINAPSDLRGWTTKPPPAIAAMPVLKTPLNFPSILEPYLSPITMVDASDASVLLIHGDADELVPLEQSEKLLEVLNENGVKSRLEIIPNAKHAFTPEELIKSLAIMAEWLEKELPVVK